MIKITFNYGDGEATKEGELVFGATVRYEGSRPKMEAFVFGESEDRNELLNLLALETAQIIVYAMPNKSSLERSTKFGHLLGRALATAKRSE